jgi:predicted TIM-barrel fold metal-dependent hydrolase
MIKFIDIHGHCVQEHCVPYSDGNLKGCNRVSTPEEMLEFYACIGVEKGVILPLGNAENMAQSQSNEEVLNIARMHPGRFIPFCNIDPRNYRNDFTSPFADGMRWYRDKGCKGLGEMCCNLSILDGRVQALFKAAEEVGFPVTFHLAPFSGNNYGLVDLPGLPGLELCLQRFPKLKFFGHSQAFWCEIGKYTGQQARFDLPQGLVEEGRVPELMRKYPNLHGDLSAGSGTNALMRDRAYAVRFLEEFQDRLLFGLDICSPEGERRLHRGPDVFLQDLLAKGEISETVFRKVARGNAERILGV